MSWDLGKGGKEMGLQELNRQLWQEQTQKAGVISKFCYPFAKLLLEKLEALKNEGRIFEKDEDEEERKKNMKKEDIYENPRPLSKIAEVVVGWLSWQIYDSGGGNYYSPCEIDEITSTAEEFLAIFENNPLIPRKGEMYDTGRIARETIKEPSEFGREPPGSDE